MQLTGFEEVTEDGITYNKPIYEEKKLIGAVFDVFAAEDIVGGDGTLYHHKDDKVGSITTSADVDKLSDLHLGKYYLKEVSAPEGYVFEDKVYEAELVYKDQDTKKVDVTVKAGNTYLPIELTVNKEKEVLKVIELEDGLVHQIVAREPGEGFVFGLYNAEEIAYEGGALAADSAVAIGTTDSEGKLVFSGLYPHGKYYVQELKTVTGWKLNTNKFNVTLDPAMKAEDDNVIRVALAQPVLNDFIYTPYTITKTNLTESETVPGALIEVLDEDGNVIYREYTDENGEIKDIPVKPGNYTFREIIAPEGYVLNVAEMKFTVDEDGMVTGDSIIHDDYTRVVLKKVDDEGTPMAGVEFQLAKKDDGTILFTATTDENGLVKFEKIPYGTYVISETKPLSGYIKNSTDIVIVIDRNYMNKDVPNFEIPNYPNEIVILKTDNRNEPLEGATFGLFDESDKQIMTAVSNDKGEVKFRKIPNGTYTIRETIAPDGFLINKTIKTVTIDDTYRNSAEPLATYINQPKKIKYIKVDTSGKALPGVEFSLIDASNNEIVETVTSNENGEFIFTKFDYGDWIIRETEAPEGFNKMDDITLHVDENWTEPEPFTCVNIPNHYEFVKTDNKGNPLPGVKFRLEDEEGNDLGEYISDENGIVRVTDLKPGTYIIREIETPKGFQRTDELIKVEINEKYIVPEEMYRLINYPNVQTGVEFQMTPLMWVGAACVLAAAGLAVVYSLKKKAVKASEKAEESNSDEDKKEAQKDSKEESESKE